MPKTVIVPPGTGTPIAHVSPGTLADGMDAGVLHTSDDFVEGIEDFGTKIQPLMTCRQPVFVTA
jgi:hypothetical protein